MICIKKSKGFTLIEVVLAVSILSIIGFAVLNLFMSATRTNNDIKRKIKASYIAQQIMEDEKAHKQSDTVKNEKYYTKEGTPMDSVTKIEDTSGYVAKVEYEKAGDISNDMPQDIFEIRVSVYFNGKMLEEISSLTRKDKPMKSKE